MAATTGSVSKYIECGVQTEIQLSSSQSSQSIPMASPQTTLPNNTNILSPALLSPPQVAHTRYHRARASANRAYKYPELSSARPSSLYNPVSSRVVSLPDTEPADLIQVLAKRIVSLPESALVPHHIRGLGISSAESPYLSSEDDASFTRVRVYPPDSEVPRTPSPPSSQESSIMIIGSDANISRGFLHHSKEFVDHYLDEGAWSTWTQSPPRPIPALHGPLSLPYARCPSGAEGTLIEGPAEELPRMIWGLDEDGRQKTSQRGASKSNTKNASPMHEPDLLKEQQSFSQTDPSSVYPEPDIFIDTGGIVFETGPIHRDWQYNLEDQGSLVVSDPSLKPGYPKSAAPSYIPPTARIFIEPRQTSPTVRPTAAEIALEFHRQQLQQSNIPTPPSSTFSSTTPALSQSSSSSTLYEVSPPLFSPGMADFGTPYSNFEAHSTREAYANESQNLRQFVFNAFNDPQSYQAHLYQNSGYDHQESNAAPVLSSTVPTRRNIDLKTAISMSQRQTTTSKATPSKHSAKDTSVPPPPPPSPQTSQKASFQPRSVPLARLMQRTLSTVPEEDGSTNQSGQRKGGSSQQDGSRTGLGINLTNTEQVWRAHQNMDDVSRSLPKKTSCAVPRSQARRVVSGTFDQNGQSKMSTVLDATTSNELSAGSKLSASKKKSNKIAKKNRVASA